MKLNEVNWGDYSEIIWSFPDDNFAGESTFEEIKSSILDRLDLDRQKLVEQVISIVEETYDDDDTKKGEALKFIVSTWYEDDDRHFYWQDESRQWWKAAYPGAQAILVPSIGGEGLVSSYWDARKEVYYETEREASGNTFGSFSSSSSSSSSDSGSTTPLNSSSELTHPPDDGSSSISYKASIYGVQPASFSVPDGAKWYYGYEQGTQKVYYKKFGAGENPPESGGVDYGDGWQEEKPDKYTWINYMTVRKSRELSGNRTLWAALGEIDGRTGQYYKLTSDGKMPSPADADCNQGWVDRANGREIVKSDKLRHREMASAREANKTSREKFPIDAAGKNKLGMVSRYDASTANKSRGGDILDNLQGRNKEQAADSINGLCEAVDKVGRRSYSDNRERTAAAVCAILGIPYDDGIEAAIKKGGSPVLPESMKRGDIYALVNSGNWGSIRHIMSDWDSETSCTAHLYSVVPAVLLEGKENKPSVEDNGIEMISLHEQKSPGRWVYCGNI